MMKCREFEEMVNELACNRLSAQVHPGLRQNALTHASACERCAGRLAAQRALNTVLVEFAEATQKEHVSPRVKQQLRAAVAERRRSPAAPEETLPALAPVIRIFPGKKLGFSHWVLAAAAMMLAIFTIMLWLRTPKPASDVLTRGVSPLPAPIRSNQAPTPFPVGPAAEVNRVATAQPSTRKPRAHRRNRTNESSANRENEIAMEFVPLTLAADERAIENGMIVRLEVPRARLVAMGLPLQMESNRETVNAEVMVGDNGVAYAIRVVR